MIDFGLSKHFRFGEVHHEAVGTPYTVAPEVIKGSYDERCDIWAIGVITFLLFSGDPPFGGCGGPEPLMQVRQNILSCDYEFEPSDIWDLVSDHGKGFVKSLLIVDPKDRPTAREAQRHAWLKHWASRDSEGNRQDNVLNPNVVKALVNFKEFSDMQKLLSEVLSFTLLPDQIKDLRKEFEIMDTDGSGEISLEALKKVLVSNAGAGSLGALTEEEVEDIFDAMRVNKADTRIHWHEFIAAGLSQCQVDDRNLRLAFDRLDGDHKGYITLDDIFKLAGNGELQNEDQMRSMWTESMRNLNCTQRHITYDNFLLLMKGQTQEPEGLERKKSTHVQQPLHSLPENAEVDGGRIVSVENGGEIGEAVSTDDEVGQVLAVEDLLDKDPDHFIPRPSLDESSFNSLPNMGANPMFESSSSITSSPPEKKSVSAVEFEVSSIIPNLGAMSKPSIVTRRRSKSLEGETLEAVEAAAEPAPGKVRTGDTRLALNLPEHGAKDKMKDDLANKTALAVNRHLYRGHRQMRLSFLDACKRFEEQQTSRARDTLMKEQVKEAMGAGLVMRHGTKFQVTSEAIRKYLEEAQAEQQVLLDKANRRGGRGRSARKKTISDMSAMMNPSMGQEELGDLATRAAAKTPEANRETMNNSFSAVHDMPDLSISGMGDGKPKLAFKPTAIGGSGSDHKKQPADMLPPNLPEVDHVDVRKATVPGRFHKTLDPFSSQGMYGGARLQNEAVSQIQSAAHPTSSRRHTTNPVKSENM